MNNYLKANIARMFLFVAFCVIFFCPENAFAHLVNQDVGEFYAGMLHPLTSAEHLLPAIALALLAGWYGVQAARWTVVVFPLALIIGTWTGNGFAYPIYSHLANLIAIIILGVLLSVNRKIPLIAILSLAAAIGLILDMKCNIEFKSVYWLVGALTGMVATMLIYLP